MTLHLEPVSFRARWYAPDKSFAAHDDYDAVALIECLGATAVIMTMLHGKMRHGYWVDLILRLQGMGVDRVFAERHGQRRTYRLLSNNRISVSNDWTFA